MEIELVKKEQKDVVCKHEVGKVYRSLGGFYYLCCKDHTCGFSLIALPESTVDAGPYETIEDLDENNKGDIEVTCKLVVED